MCAVRVLDRRDAVSRRQPGATDRQPPAAPRRRGRRAPTLGCREPWTRSSPRAWPRTPPIARAPPWSWRRPPAKPSPRLCPCRGLRSRRTGLRSRPRPRLAAAAATADQDGRPRQTVLRSVRTPLRANSHPRPLTRRVPAPPWRRRKPVVISVRGAAGLIRGLPLSLPLAFIGNQAHHRRTPGRRRCRSPASVSARAVGRQRRHGVRRRHSHNRILALPAGDRPSRAAVRRSQFSDRCDG